MRFFNYSDAVPDTRVFTGISLPGKEVLTIDTLVDWRRSSWM